MWAVVQEQGIKRVMGGVSHQSEPQKKTWPHHLPWPSCQFNCGDGQPTKLFPNCNSSNACQSLNTITNKVVWRYLSGTDSVGVWGVGKILQKIISPRRFVRTDATAAESEQDLTNCSFIRRSFWYKMAAWNSFPLFFFFLSPTYCFASTKGLISPTYKSLAVTAATWKQATARNSLGEELEDRD